MQIHMWLYLSFSLWEKAFRLRIIQKKTDQRHFIATPNLSTFAVRCSVKNFFAPSSLIRTAEEQQRDRQLQRVMLFKKNAMMIKMTEIVVALTQSNLSMPDTTVTEKKCPL